MLFPALGVQNEEWFNLDEEPKDLSGNCVAVVIDKVDGEPCRFYNFLVQK